MKVHVVWKQSHLNLIINSMGRFTEGFCRAGHKITFKVFQKVEASKISAEQLLFHVYLSLNASNANQTL